MDRFCEESVNRCRDRNSNDKTELNHSMHDIWTHEISQQVNIFEILTTVLLIVISQQPRTLKVLEQVKLNHNQRPQISGAPNFVARL